jgi:hypothetical protein
MSTISSSNSSVVAIMIQQHQLQQQKTAYAATKGTCGSSYNGISLGGDIEGRAGEL